MNVPAAKCVVDGDCDATPSHDATRHRPNERTNERAQSSDDDAESRTAASGWRDVDSHRTAPRSVGRSVVRSPIGSKSPG